MSSGTALADEEFSEFLAYLERSLGRSRGSLSPDTDLTATGEFDSLAKLELLAVLSERVTASDDSAIAILEQLVSSSSTIGELWGRIKGRSE